MLTDPFSACASDPTRSVSPRFNALAREFMRDGKSRRKLVISFRMSFSSLFTRRASTSIGFSSNVSTSGRATEDSRDNRSRIASSVSSLNGLPITSSNPAASNRSRSCAVVFEVTATSSRGRLASTLRLRKGLAVSIPSITRISSSNSATSKRTCCAAVTASLPFATATTRCPACVSWPDTSARTSS